MLSKRKSIGDYTIGKTIGQGAFSKVKIAFNKVTKEEVAIKIINKKQLELKNKKTKENKEIYKKKQEHEEQKKKRAIENAVHRHSAPKIESNNRENFNFNNKNEVINKYRNIQTKKEEQNDTTSNKPENTNKIDAANNNSAKPEDSKKENTTTETKTDEKTKVEETKVEEVKSEAKDENKEKVDEEKINIKNAENIKSENTNTENNNIRSTNNKPSEIHLNDNVIRKHGQNPSIIPEESETEDENAEKIKADNGSVKKASNVFKRLSDSNINSSFHSKVYVTEGQSNDENSLKNRKFSLDSNSKNHIVNNTVDVCTPLQSIDNPYEERTEDSKMKDNSIFLTDHSAIPLPSYYERLQNEVQLMMRLDHPNIIKIYQVIESEDETLIVMEYAPGGELIDYILTKKHLNETEARKFFRQIISAIDHCHMANVVHRDLKLENLLLSKDKNILITDFGLGRTFDGSTKDYMTTFCGTPNYAAIELISGIPYIGVKSDIWALGVILYVMMTGKPPFDGKSINALYRRIKRIDYKVPSYFSKDLTKLLAKIFVRDPEKRADINDLRDDPWVNYEEIEKPIRIFPINAQDMQQIVSGITNGNGYISYIFREPSTSPTKKKESTYNLSMAISQNNIHDCHLISNERRRSNAYEDIKRRLNFTTAAKSPLSNSPEKDKSPFRNMTSCEIPNMDIWGGVLVDSSFGFKLRNKALSVMETGTNGLCGGLNSNSEHSSNVDINRASRTAANRHCLRLNTNVTNTPPPMINSADDYCNSPRYYSIINIADRSPVNPDEGDGDNVSSLKSYSKSISVITDESLYQNNNAAPNVRPNPRVGLRNRTNSELQRSNSYGISGLLNKRRNKIDNPNIDRRISISTSHPRASSTACISGQVNQTNVTVPVNAQITNPTSPGKRDTRKPSPLDPSVKGEVSPTSEVFSDSFETNNEFNSQEDDGIPDYKEIEMWHLIHKPSKTIRSTRLNFNKSTATSKPPFTLFQNLCWALYEMKNVYIDRFYFIRNPNLYLFECHLLEEDLSTISVKFEVEVCKVWLLKIYALRFKRITGSPFLYEELYNELLSLLKTDEEVNKEINNEFELPKASEVNV